MAHTCAQVSSDVTSGQYQNVPGCDVKKRNCISCVFMPSFFPFSILVSWKTFPQFCAFWDTDYVLLSVKGINTSPCFLFVCLFV